MIALNAVLECNKQYGRPTLFVRERSTCVLDNVREATLLVLSNFKYYNQSTPNTTASGGWPGKRYPESDKLSQSPASSMQLLTLPRGP
jgi:hypothetical protein